MKYLIVFAAVLAFAAGEGEFDSANVRPIDDFPFFQATIPQFKRNTIDGSGTGSRINGGNMADLEDFPYLVTNWNDSLTNRKRELFLIRSTITGFTAN